MQNFVANLHSLNFFRPDRFAVGHGKPRYLDRPVCAPLDSHIPRQHFYRHLDAALDLSIVRDWVADLYAAVDRPSYLSGVGPRSAVGAIKVTLSVTPVRTFSCASRPVWASTTSASASAYGYARIVRAASSNVPYGCECDITVVMWPGCDARRATNP